MLDAAMVPGDTLRFKGTMQISKQHLLVSGSAYVKWNLAGVPLVFPVHGQHDHYFCPELHHVVAA
jgi:hypothetical protein